MRIPTYGKTTYEREVLFNVMTLAIAVPALIFAIGAAVHDLIQAFTH